jgi:hypothetical protein
VIRGKNERLGLRQNATATPKAKPPDKGKRHGKIILPRLRLRVAKNQLTEPSWL